MKTRNWILSAAGAALLLSACNDKEVILPGKRENLRGGDEIVEIQNQARSISLPGQRQNSSWTHRPGSATYRNAHAALSPAPKLLWSADIGQGNERKQRLTADPVVADGKIFTMDSKGNLSAFSLSGAQIWTRNLTPPRDKEDDAAGAGSHTTTISSS